MRYASRPPRAQRVRCLACDTLHLPRVPRTYQLPAHDAPCGSPCSGGGACPGHPYACGCGAVTQPRDGLRDGDTYGCRTSVRDPAPDVPAALPDPRAFRPARGP